MERLFCRAERIRPQAWKGHGPRNDAARSSHERPRHGRGGDPHISVATADRRRSEEHTSELQSLMRNSYAVFCLKKTTISNTHSNTASATHTTQTKKQMVYNNS